MRIRILKETGGYRPGAEVDGAPELCEGWIEAGLAELAEAPESTPAPAPESAPGPPEVEAAVDDEAEHAVSQRKAGRRRS